MSRARGAGDAGTETEPATPDGAGPTDGPASGGHTRNLGVDASAASATAVATVATADPWQALRRFTAARIALGHAGVSLPTARHLEFQLAHARARDTVHASLDADGLESALYGSGLDVVRLRSAAPDRYTYLQRPDLGRRLDAPSRQRLLELQGSEADARFDVAFIVADGLSAQAVARHAAPLLGRVLPNLAEEGRTVAPVAVVLQGRVAIGDEVGELLGARLAVVLIGERPGLSSPDSLGVYLTWSPRVGRTDAERNCISNVRPEGLGYDEAALRLTWLLQQARARGLSGVALKDETDATSASIASMSTFLLPE